MQLLPVLIALGATVLDSSIGGLGGCPFALRATGNIATEDLDYLLNREGIPTGLHHAALAEVAGWLKDKLEMKLSGQLTDAGWPIGMSADPSG
ncbi:beta/alpha barrel domain-containing protein [Neorhizobium alkalisoli]|uniref:hypothetical protein n=1 Tax=Neorhizobium alkalisoli TaxID=528178 RepID=UPI00131A0D36